MIPVQNIYYMLSYAFQVLNEKGYKDIATEQFDNVAELCAAILSKGITVQLKRGLGKEYIPQTEALSSLRGKIDITESMAERVRKLVEENARVRRDQEEYQREYDVLAAEHEKLSRQMQEVEVWKKDKIDRRRRIEVFLHMLEEQEECVRFDPYTFVALVGKVVVGQNRKLEFVFRNGMNFCWLMQ